MKISINDNTMELHNNTSIAELLKTELHIAVNKKGIAVAVNETIVPREEWNNYTIKDQDKILVITASQGG